MNSQSTETLRNDSTGLDRAADLLRQGRLVAFPTETVYGLGADACNATAVAEIFAAKNRPAFNPLIVHVANLDAARAIADFPDPALQLATAFWPGALTLVLPTKPSAGIAPSVSVGLPTIAIRVPAHATAQNLLTRFAGPIAAPSANPSGQVSPTTAAHVVESLDGRIAAVLDGGACNLGIESTIIGFDSAPTLLRPGSLPAEVIEKCIGRALTHPTQQLTVTSPGQLASHYAPSATLRLNAQKARADEVLLGFGPVDCTLNLSPSGDLTEAAANLFRHLRKLDSQNIAQIAVSPIPNHGMGHAINDRLSRAAAPRR